MGVNLTAVQKFVVLKPALSLSKGEAKDPRERLAAIGSSQRSATDSFDRSLMESSQTIARKDPSLCSRSRQTEKGSLLGCLSIYQMRVTYAA